MSVDPRQVTRILHSETGHNTIFDLAVDGGERTKAMIVDWQYEPIKGSLLHIDLKRIAMDQKLTVSVPIELKGEAAGVKTAGRHSGADLREVEVECLPGDIPSAIEVNVANWCSARCCASPICRRATRLKFLTDAEPAGGAHHHRQGRSGCDSGSGGWRSRGGSCRARSHQEGQAGDGRRSCEPAKPRRPRRKRRSSCWHRLSWRPVRSDWIGFRGRPIRRGSCDELRTA